MLPVVIGSLKSIIAVIAVFVVCIVIHEYGHYIAAKKSGVAVPAFAIGFGPKLFRWTRGGTEFSIRLFPLGGLVQLAGEMPQEAMFQMGEEISVILNDERQVVVLGDPTDVPGGITGILRDIDLSDHMRLKMEVDGEETTFPIRPRAKLMTSTRSSIPLVEKHEAVLGKPLWQRAIMILAGPLMNFLLAAVVFSAVFMHNGYPTNEPRLGQVIPGSAAAAVGLKSGDQILSVNGHPVATWTDLVEQIRSVPVRPVHPIHLTLERSGHPLSVNVTPHVVGATPQIGIYPTVGYNPLVAVGKGIHYVYYTSVNAIQLYGQVISHHEFNMLSGPVGISAVISQQAQSGLWNVITICGLLSLNLGLFNLLPIPALDGGRLLFMLVELVRGRSVDPRREGLVHLLGFALLMFFAVLITYRDVTRLF